MSEAEIPRDAVTLNPPHSYVRAPPALAGCWCPDPNLLAYFYNNIRQREVRCPAEYILTLGTAHVLGGQYVMAADGQWLAPSVVDYPAADAMRPAVLERVAAGDVRRLAPAGKPTVVIAKAGGNNYGHTVVEILPRIISLARSPLRDIRLLLPDGMAAFAPMLARMLAALGITAELVHVPEQQVTEVQELVYVGPVSRHNMRKSQTVLVLRDLLWHSAGVTPAPSRRLYVERPPSEQRSLANAGEVRAILEAAGYETVHPATMPFEDQVALFAQAGHIVGSLGAGLTNTLLAPPSCRVTMIDPGLADYFFWDLAALAGQDFTWMFTGPIAFFSQELASAPFPVDLDGLRYVLRQAG